MFREGKEPQLQPGSATSVPDDTYTLSEIEPGPRVDLELIAIVVCDACWRDFRPSIRSSVQQSLRIFVARVFKHGRRPAGLHDSAAMHHVDAVAQQMDDIDVV